MSAVMISGVDSIFVFETYYPLGGITEAARCHVPFFFCFPCLLRSLALVSLSPSHFQEQLHSAIFVLNMLKWLDVYHCH